MNSEPDNGGPNVPAFDPPGGENHFLASRRGLYTYAHLDRFRRFFQGFLSDYGHSPERPVGFLAESSDELIFALAACWQLGIPFCCFDPHAPKREFERRLQRIRPGYLFYGEKQTEKAPVENSSPLSALELDRALEERADPVENEEKTSARTRPAAVFGYFFTSGTSGPPKVVPLRRRQMHFAARASARNFRPDPNHFWLLCLPLNHIGGVSIILRSLLYGSGVYRMNRFDREMVATFLYENTLFQAASLVPTMLKRLLEIPAFQTHRNFKAILLGGGPIDPELIRKTVEKGIPLVPSYGMTETCAQIAANPVLKPSGIYTPLKSVGQVFEPNEIRIRDSRGQEVPANSSGTIWLRGPQVFDGYLDPGGNGAEEAEEPEEAAFDGEGWFNTGDYGRLNINGQLIVEARRTDLIITGGENVSPHEVETELARLDGILEAAVIGLPDKEWGQRVAAAVVTEGENEFDAGALIEKLKGRLTEYKVPKRILRVDTLPHTPSGKIKRKEVISLFRDKS